MEQQNLTYKATGTQQHQLHQRIQTNCRNMKSRHQHTSIADDGDRFTGGRTEKVCTTPPRSSSFFLRTSTTTPTYLSHLFSCDCPQTIVTVLTIE